jgi:hypothetical protein
MVVDLDVAGEHLTDINPTYWMGNDANPSIKGQLNNSNPETEEAWLEALLGWVYDDPQVTYIKKVEAGSSGLGSNVRQLSDYAPGFDWDYAVVKYGNYWIAYADTGADGKLSSGDEKLTTGTLKYGISHITFFDPPPPTQVPEPATMLLLGIGLVGLAGVRRKLN